MTAAEDLGRLLADALSRIAILEGASQAQHSTLETSGGTVGLGDAVTTAVDTAAALPAVEESAATAQETADSIAVMTDDWDDDLDTHLEDMAASLDDASADLEDSQADIEGAFGATVDGLSEDVETAITAAGDAKTEAQAASDAALAAAGLAASKGKTIVQVSAPTGANADPANLWINISTDSSGAPKNQPNRYNPDTAKWEPITDAQAVAAAQAAATAVAAAQAAKDVADQANAAAGVAKQAAADANTQALLAAGIANGKGKVIYQASKPTGVNAAVGNLWIRTSDNTPWAYDASIPDWVQVTDQTAKDAAAAAVTAQQAATAAANAASAAQATADSKPLILFSSTSGPSGTAPTGSTWFLWDSAKNIAGQWLQSGTLANPVWTPQQITSQVIANVDLGKLTAGSAAIADLVAQKVAASTANFQTANVSNLFVTQGATLSQAVIDFLFVNVVQAKKITAGMIDVDSLNGITLTGTRIKSAASGQRVEVVSNQVNFYNSKDALGGIIRGGYSTWGGVDYPLVYLGGGDFGASVGGGQPIWQGTAVGLRVNGDTAVKRVFLDPAAASDGYVCGIYGFAKKSSSDATPIPMPLLYAKGNTGSAYPDMFIENIKSVTAENYLLPDGTSISADTGWVTIPLRNGYSIHAGRTPQIRRKGGITYMRGGIAPTAGGTFSASQDQTFGDLPNGFTQPVQGSYFGSFIGKSSGLSGTIAVENGVIRLSPGTSTAAYAYLNAVVYPND